MSWFFKSAAEKEADRRIADKAESDRKGNFEAEVQRIVDKKSGNSTRNSTSNTGSSTRDDYDGSSSAFD